MTVYSKEQRLKVVECFFENNESSISAQGVYKEI